MRKTKIVILTVFLALISAGAFAGEYHCDLEECEDDAGCSGLYGDVDGCRIQCYRAGGGPGEIEKSSSATCSELAP